MIRSYTSRILESDEGPLDIGDSNNDDVVLIDFEFAGWYPNYWEYARAIFACR